MNEIKIITFLSFCGFFVAIVGMWSDSKRK
ncbi:putative membrane protein (plasmid) [Bacillus cereus 03BB108]|uniref:Membrane protein n=1 Tax=Bacillus cereus 03BB108 TaxID=451709 RepID=A0AAN0W4M1_BACCE|nr:putative membrane protein [Bacillus cereus 03BB108]